MKTKQGQIIVARTVTPVWLLSDKGRIYDVARLDTPRRARHQR
jgi:hypothetical protein